MAEALDRLYAAREFERVSYVLEPVGDTAARLVISAGRRGGSRLGFGLRYETTYKASLLLTAELVGATGAAGLTTMDLRLGEQAHGLVTHQRRLGALAPWALGVRGGYQRVPLDIYDGSQRVAQGRFHVIGGSVLLGAAGATAALGGLLLTGEHLRTTVSTGATPPDSVPSERTFYTVGADLRVDTRDAPTHPRRGVLVQARAEWADRAIGSGGTFAQQLARVEGAVPAGPVSLVLRAEAGAARGADLPEHYRFFLGGAVPFYMLPDRHRPFLGLRVQERSGTHYQVVGAGVQASLPAAFIARIEWNAGTAGNEAEWEPAAWLHGAGAMLAVRTVFGTLALHAATALPDGTYLFELDFGTGF
jgi:outer membrane protein assembly factor BamA